MGVVGATGVGASRRRGAGSPPSKKTTSRVSTTARFFGSQTLYPPPPYLYPTKKHIDERSSSFFSFTAGSTTAHGAPNARKSETSGGVPYTASTGVRPLSAFVGTRFRVYVAVLKASAHKDLGKPELLSIARTLFVRMPMVRSATPLDAGWYSAVVLSFMPSRLQNTCISPMLSSQALSVRTSCSLFPDSLSAAALKVLNASIASDL